MFRRLGDVKALYYRYVCFLLSVPKRFFAHKFPEKFETREPGEIIMDCTSCMIIIEFGKR